MLFNVRLRSHILFVGFYMRGVNRWTALWLLVHWRSALTIRPATSVSDIAYRLVISACILRVKLLLLDSILFLLLELSMSRVRSLRLLVGNTPIIFGKHFFKLSCSFLRFQKSPVKWTLFIGCSNSFPPAFLGSISRWLIILIILLKWMDFLLSLILTPPFRVN